jgi:glycosyltransferase involved in cell wall biosynthesis
MTGSPLVSVIIPFYNAYETLPLALASLLAQTYEEWEAVMVDDGSTDKSMKLVEKMTDPRFRLFRLERNMGRGAARQIALDHTKGDFLSMLDADDWLYPDKLETQVEFAEQHPGIAVVSAGMAIVDKSNTLVGVRGRAAGASPDVFEPMERLARPPICHAPSLIRMDAARKASYDPRFIRGEDADYLFSILAEHRFSVLPRITYAYTEFNSVNLNDLLTSHASERQFYLKYRERFPVSSMVRWATSYRKTIGCLFFHATGSKRVLTARRSMDAMTQDHEEFSAAFHCVSSIAASLSLSEC